MEAVYSLQIFFTIEIIETANAGFIKMFLSQNFIVGYLNIAYFLNMLAAAVSFYMSKSTIHLLSNLEYMLSTFALRYEQMK